MFEPIPLPVPGSSNRNFTFECRKNTPCKAAIRPASWDSNGGILVNEPDISGPLGISADEFLVTGGTLVLGVARQHALYAHADTLDVVDGTPALGAEQIEADDAVGVDVGVDGHGPLWRFGHKCDFRRF